MLDKEEKMLNVRVVRSAILAGVAFLLIGLFRELPEAEPLKVGLVGVFLAIILISLLVLVVISFSSHNDEEDGHVE